MGKNVSQQLIGTHLVEGRMEAGQEIGLRIDQTFTQDATGSMVMLELAAIHLSRVKTALSAAILGWCCPITHTRAGRCLRGGRLLEGRRVPCAVGSSYVKSSTQCTTGTRVSWRR